MGFSDDTTAVFRHMYTMEKTGTDQEQKKGRGKK